MTEENFREQINRMQHSIWILQDRLSDSEKWKAAYLRQLEELKAKLRELAG